MSRYPPPLAERFAAAVRDLAARLRIVESRTVGLTGSPVYARSGTVDPAYTAGDPLVTVDGDAVLTGPYRRLATYTPAAGDRVVLVPVGASYVAIGKV